VKVKSLVDRITLYLRSWVEMSGLEMTVEGLTELFVKDSFFLSQSREIQIFLKEAGKQFEGNDGMMSELP